MGTQASGDLRSSGDCAVQVAGVLRQLHNDPLQMWACTLCGFLASLTMIAWESAVQVAGMLSQPSSPQAAGDSSVEGTLDAQQDEEMLGGVLYVSGEESKEQVGLRHCMR